MISFSFWSLAPRSVEESVAEDRGKTPWRRRRTSDPIGPPRLSVIPNCMYASTYSFVRSHRTQKRSPSFSERKGGAPVLTSSSSSFEWWAFVFSFGKSRNILHELSQVSMNFCRNQERYLKLLAFELRLLLSHNFKISFSFSLSLALSLSTSVWLSLLVLFSSPNSDLPFSNAFFNFFSSLWFGTRSRLRGYSNRCCQVSFSKGMFREGSEVISLMA